MLFRLQSGTYELVEEHRDGWNPEIFKERYSDILDKYDYIVGDWGYGQLRLRGFYDDANRKVPFEQKIAVLDEYLQEFCNFGCAYFVLRKVKSSEPGVAGTSSVSSSEPGETGGSGDKSSKGLEPSSQTRYTRPHEQRKANQLRPRERQEGSGEQRSAYTERNTRQARTDTKERGGVRQDRNGRTERSFPNERRGGPANGRGVRNK
uniref:YutD family protein n=1 Tax=Brevibacillus massiliensis TaxID=1118054 RepID=UPI000301A262